MPDISQRAVGTAGELRKDGGEGVLAGGIDDPVHADGLGEGHAVGADLGGDDARGAHRLRHRRREEADRPHAGDEEAPARDGAVGDGVHRIPERVLEGGEVRRNGAVGRHRAPGGDRRKGREAAVDVDAEDAGVRADVRLPGEALGATAADGVALGGDEIAHLHLLDPFADLHDRAAELVPDDARRVDATGGPGVPLPDVQVGAADGGGLQAELDLARSRRTLGDLDDLDAGFGPDLRDGVH